MEQASRSEEEFIERLARVLEQDGPRIAGRIVALLLLSPADLPIEEIAERLQVSKASISTNARMLEQWGVVQRVTHPGDRRDHYRVRDDGLVRLLERRVDWMRRLGEVVEEGTQTPAAAEPAVDARFCTLLRLHRFALRDAERTLRRLLREARGAR